MKFIPKALRSRDDISISGIMGMWVSHLSSNSLTLVGRLVLSARGCTFTIIIVAVMGVMILLHGAFEADRFSDFAHNLSVALGFYVSVSAHLFMRNKRTQICDLFRKLSIAAKNVEQIASGESKDAMSRTCWFMRNAYLAVHGYAILIFVSLCAMSFITGKPYIPIWPLPQNPSLQMTMTFWQVIAILVCCWGYYSAEILLMNFLVHIDLVSFVLPAISVYFAIKDYINLYDAAVLPIVAILYSPMAYAGEEFENSSTDISKCIYFGSWLEKDRRMRKDLLLVMKRTMHPAKISVNGVGSYNLKAANTFIKQLYSFTSMLINMD